MKHFLKPVVVIATFAFLTSTSVQAEPQEKMIIALKTSDFELAETDISTLAIGEAQTVETQSGKVIDILRTADGAEIYVDGELLDIDFNHDDEQNVHIVKKHVEVNCDNDEDCDENVFILTGNDSEALDLILGDGKNIIIHKEVELSCSDAEETSSCTEQTAWAPADDDLNIDELHMMHGGDARQKIIVIKKEAIVED